MSADPTPGEAQRSVDALVPANWTADEQVIAATLNALREEPAPTWHPAEPAVLHVPTEWSAPLPGPDTLDVQRTRSPEPVSTPPEPPEASPEPTASEAREPAPADSTLPAVRTRRSRHEAVIVEDQRMPEQAPRRRAGLFTRLLTVRTFRAQHGLPKATKQDAAVGALLDAATAQGVLSLHNRRVPGRRGRIEHIAVGASGIYIIDVKHFKNASIEVRPAGDASADTGDLVVGGRVMTAAVVATGRRVAALRSLLAAVGLDDIPVTGAVCFVDGMLPLAVSDLEVAGIHVIRPSSLTALVATAGPLVADDRQALRQFLAEQLPGSA